MVSTFAEFGTPFTTKCKYSQKGFGDRVLALNQGAKIVHEKRENVSKKIGEESN